MPNQTFSIVESEEIGINTSIGEFSIVRRGAVIGKNVIIHPHVIINPGVVLGDNSEIFPGTILGKVPKAPGVLAREPNFQEEILVEANCCIGPHAILYYGVKIGNNTLIGDGVSIREGCSIGSFCIISRYVTINYNSHVGDHTKIMDMSHITGNCSIGNHVFISTSVMTTNDNALGKKGYSEKSILGPRIEDGAAIGAGANLLPGIFVGKGAIVGAGSVVTSDVEPHTLVIGAPARFRRKLEEEKKL